MYPRQARIPLQSIPALVAKKNRTPKKESKNHLFCFRNVLVTNRISSYANADMYSLKKCNWGSVLIISHADSLLVSNIAWIATFRSSPKLPTSPSLGFPLVCFLLLRFRLCCHRGQRPPANPHYLIHLQTLGQRMGDEKLRHFSLKLVDRRREVFRRRACPRSPPLPRSVPMSSRA